MLAQTFLYKYKQWLIKTVHSWVAGSFDLFHSVSHPTQWGAQNLSIPFSCCLGSKFWVLSSRYWALGSRFWVLSSCLGWFWLWLVSSTTQDQICTTGGLLGSQRHSSGCSILQLSEFKVQSNPQVRTWRPDTGKGHPAGSTDPHFSCP